MVPNSCKPSPHTPPKSKESITPPLDVNQRLIVKEGYHFDSPHGRCVRIFSVNSHILNVIQEEEGSGLSLSRCDTIEMQIARHFVASKGCLPVSEVLSDVTLT
jgi:hypothetical protein